ncbi:hypothetical protein Tco_1300524 [Tanacetum coccineum]
MTSLNYHLNPLFTIKECSSCGSLYNKGYCCTPDSSQQLLCDCLKCGNPVEGLNCQGCALWRKKLKEVWFIICHENGMYQDLLNSYESSDDDTNVVNDPREPFVVKQDPGENSSQSPPQINHNFCYECGDSLDGIFCQRCTCFDQFQPPQYTVNHPIFNAQNEFLSSQNKIMEQMTSICDMVGQYMQKKEEDRRITEDQAAKDRYWKIPICYNDDEDEYSFATQEYLKKFSSAITPDLPKSDSLIMEDEHLDTILETESNKLIKSSVEDLVHNPSDSDGISKGECDLPVFDDFSPKKDECLTVISSPKIDFLIKEFAGELALIAPNPLGIVEADLNPKEDIRFIENLMYDNSFSRPPETLKDDYEIVIDSNNDYFSSDDDSYENIDYVDASPPDSKIVNLEVVEIVISKVGGIDTDILLTIKDDILREKLLKVNLLIANIEALIDNSTLSSDFVTKSPSTSLNLFLEETNTVDNSLPESKTFRFNLEEISSGSTTTHSDFSLSKYDSFIFDLSINPFPPADRSDCYHEKFAGELAHIISPPEYDCFYFKNEPELGNLTMDVVEDIFPTREPRVHVPNVLPTHPTLHLDLDFILFSDSLFAYIVWIFLPFLTYPVDSPLLLFTRSEDTIFDPGYPDFEDSRAHGFVHSFSRASYPQLHLGNPIS